MGDEAECCVGLGELGEYRDEERTESFEASLSRLEALF
jgi:hypothetical protein